MAQEYDLEKAWLDKFGRALDETAGAQIRTQVVEGSAGLCAKSERNEVIAWTKTAMDRLESLVDEPHRQAILLRCACQYPRADLQEMREVYAATGDVDRVHCMLQRQFEAFLRQGLKLGDDQVAKVVGCGWGSAGIKQEPSTIIATKIPKSGNLLAYLAESDPHRKRQLYCHCPRIRDVLQTGETLSPTYCYCGAGFYKGIWEEILQQPVDVAVLESILEGNDVCRFAIRLPEGCYVHLSPNQGGSA
jgi:predicted hydrocarbon binding protein